MDAVVVGRLEDKLSIVTGGGRGIGKAVALAFSREGSHVIIAEKDSGTGRAVEAEIRRNGHDATFVQLDVTCQDDVSAVVTNVVEQVGVPAVLVNNAGGDICCDPLKLTSVEWRRCMALNLEAALYCCLAVLPHMVTNRQGSIINIASVHGSNIVRGAFPYPVAKHGLIGLTRALAIEYAEHGIRVNSISPGYIETELVRENWIRSGDPTGMQAKIDNELPPRRHGRPEEVAMAAVFLASDEAPYINAVDLVIDGGRSVCY